MANSIADGEVIISSAVSVLDDLLAPLNNFTLNVSSETTGRGATVRVPLIDSSAGARVFSNATAPKGYEADSDSDASTIDISVEEIIKPFSLSDNELYKSPVNLSNYIESNANAFGLFIMNKVKTAVEAGGAAGSTAIGAKSATTFDLATVKTLVKHLDSSGVPVNDRHLIVSNVAHHQLL